MNNTELLQQIDEILEVKNFLDLYERAFEFNKTYIKTEFYKNTKLPLMDLIKTYRINKLINIEGLFAKVQKAINELNLENLTNILEQFGGAFKKEAGELGEQSELIKQYFTQINEPKK